MDEKKALKTEHHSGSESDGSEHISDLPAVSELEAAIAALPSGYISKKNIKGKTYDYYQWKEDGKLKSRYLKKEELPDLKEKIEKRRELQKKLRSGRQLKRLKAYSERIRMGNQVAIGIQSYEKMIEKKLFYIDKTDFIRQWWESNDDATLIIRPRRFGKTLNLDMLNCFFSNRYTGRKDLFEGLSVWRHKKYRDLQGTVPVINLSFAAVKSSNYKNMLFQIGCAVSNCYAYYAFFFDHMQDELKFSSAISEKYRSRWNQLGNACSNKDITEEQIINSVQELSGLLNELYHQKVLIFLDEYDTPLQEAYFYGYHEEAVSFMRAFFNRTFKTNPWLDRFLMTGICRITKESLFSDMNHLKVVTTTTDKYETCFGFTEVEVFAALEEQGIGSDENKAKVKAMYDGFCFGHEKDIYNPWSIINYLQTGQFQCWWVNTSSNELVAQLMAQGGTEMKYALEDLIAGKTLVTELSEETVFQDLKKDASAVWSLLLCSGYLRIVHIFPADELSEISDRIRCELALTNREVTAMMRSLIRRWFRPASDQYNEFIKYLFMEDTDALNEYMNQILEATISYFDTGDGGCAEQFYHGFVLGMLVQLNNAYLVRSNRESGFGRYDVMLIPRSMDGDAYIMEFKVFNKRRETSIEDTVKSALAQIKKKNYKAELLDMGFREEQIHSYGLAFKGKEALIEEACSTRIVSD